jgi:hypothetical protein
VGATSSTPPQVSPVSEFMVSDYFAHSRPHPRVIKSFRQ